MEATVGVIGLGAMGGPMAANLVRAGFHVLGCEPDAGRAGQARGAGVEVLGSVAEVAAACGATLISLVRNQPQTDAVVAALPSRRLDFVIMSTITPTGIQRVAAALRGKGVTVVDAPVSGGVQGARDGTLSIMAAGPPRAVNRVRPVLEVLGSNIFTVGSRPGAGQAVKLANQLILAVNMLGAFEGLKLAREYGLTPEQVLPILNVSTAGGYVTQNWEAVRSFWEDYEPGNALDIIYKDLRSLLGDAAERELSLPVTALAFHRLKEAW